MNHEGVHLLHGLYRLHRGKFGRLPRNPAKFGFGNLDTKRYYKYFWKNDYSEIYARCSQILDIVKGDRSKITPEFLKYLAERYRKGDMGLRDNNMNDFFSFITDWDKAAKFIRDKAPMIGATTIPSYKILQNQEE